MKKNIIAIILIIGLLFLAVFVTYKVTSKKYEEPIIESLTVFGNKIKVIPGKRVYRIHLKEAELKSVSNGCELPYEIKFKNDYKVSNGIIYLEDGEAHAYFGINAYKPDDKSKEDDVDDEDHSDDIYTETYDFYLDVDFEKPFKKSC